MSVFTFTIDFFSYFSSSSFPPLPHHRLLYLFSYIVDCSVGRGLELGQVIRAGLVSILDHTHPVASDTDARPSYLLFFSFLVVLFLSLS